MPEGQDGVQPTDPYTPLLRAYAGDRVEVRTVIGAVDSIHSFRLQGPRWFAEPSYEDSGFRDTQGMGISEHFEMIFDLPPAGAAAGNLAFVDSLYAASGSTQGQVKGSWGILRSYQQPVADLVPLPDNPPGARKAQPGFYEPPPGAVVREFAVQACSPPTASRSATRWPAAPPKVRWCCARRPATGSGSPSRTSSTRPRWPRLKTQFGATPWSGDASSARDYRGLPHLGHRRPAADAALLRRHQLPPASTSASTSRQTAATKGDKKKVTYTWYAGDIQLDAKGERKLVPIEFGGVNLLPADPLLQVSYGLWGAS